MSGFERTIERFDYQGERQGIKISTNDPVLAAIWNHLAKHTIEKFAVTEWLPHGFLKTGYYGKYSLSELRFFLKLEEMKFTITPEGLDYLEWLQARNPKRTQERLKKYAKTRTL